MSGVGAGMSSNEGSRLTSLSEPGLHVDRQRSIDFANFPAFPAHRKNSLRARKYSLRARVGNSSSIMLATARSHGRQRLAGSASLSARGSRRPHHVESVVLFPAARLRAETRTSHRSLYSAPSPYSNSSRFFLLMNAGWTGASGLIRPSAPHSAIRLNGIAGRSAIRCNSARKSETMPRSLVSTAAASE